VPNALAEETSPYLRQHAENPVDWLPWGDEALRRARELDRPLLVSIGYSACHWCHVMERESFEDPRTAELMNENFVCVKVDREERPDVDALYMEAVHGMTGRGGWPLNVFLTPEQLPFYGGTYFPPDSRSGMPAWTQVLQAISEAWSERREEIRAGGEGVRERLSGGAALEPSAEILDASVLDDAVARLAEHFDQRHGGFGGAPKFPPASAIEFLLARASVRSDPLATPAADMALRTLDAMAGGGIHDVLGGGFHRYAVDGSWTVPHFEKMLYDNALLARAYLHGYQASGESRLLEICTGTLDWALREMRAPDGGFYASLDADSGGVEGRFYVWTTAELRETLGEDADPAIAWLGLTERGNFEDPHHPQTGLNVLTDRGPRPEQATRERIRARLLGVRETRERPGLDDKRLTSWNALMIAALADAGAALPDSPYLEAAGACAEFLEHDLRDASGRLLRTYNDGRAKIDAYLEDHGLLLEALIALFEASCEERWFLSATALADEIIARFADPDRGGFFSTASDGEVLIARRKELEDTPIPSGSSSAALGLLRLSQLTGNEDYERHALGAIALVAEIAPRLPSSFGHMLQAMHWRLEPARPIACPLPTVPQRASRPPEPGRA
jgi:uncharacterized protein YyaL (SSP411 family)